MGEKDITEKLLEDYDEIFADIVNVLLFDGKEILTPGSLAPFGTRSQYKADDGKIHEQERDIAKCWKNGKIMFAIFGLENQTKADKLMPLRVLGYDGGTYKSQIVSKKKNILPVVTLVLYYGREHWKTPTNLKKTISIPKEIDKYVNDYNIHVFEISWLSQKQIKMFKSDFGVVADFFVNRRKDPNYIPRDRRKIKHIEEVLKLLSAFTGDYRYEEVLEDPDIREVDNMCEVFDRAWNGGKAEGKAEELFSLVQDGIISAEIAAKRMKVSVKKFEKLMNEAGYKMPEMV